MKTQLEELLLQALGNLQHQGILPQECSLNPQLTHTRNPEHGDFATNCALVLAKIANVPPKALAEKIIQEMAESPLLKKIELAGPGFINFHLNAQSASHIIQTILQQGDEFGNNLSGEHKRIHVEYVSSNPTGPLHVGHGRQAAYGDCVANLLVANGFHVHREYYVNDAGRQMSILAISTLLRYQEIKGQTVNFPRNGYQGDYIKTIANALDDFPENYVINLEELYRDVPQDLQDDDSGDKEKHIDGLIANAKKLLGEKQFLKVLNLVLTEILADIRDDLSEFNVHFDEWFSERSLLDSGALQHGIETLKAKGLTYEKAGALWFRSTDFGDEKDRVLIRANGITTYFASDVAYHLNKLERGNELILDILGADHHGYYPRVRAIMTALRGNPECLNVSLVQFVTLYRQQKKVQMSTRSASYVTLRELREEVGNDAARFFYILRKNEQHLDFDLDLAKSHSNDNPIYYIQYAHARVASVQRELNKQELHWDKTAGLAQLTRLNTEHEKALMRNLSRFPEIVYNAGHQYDPHLVAHYLRDLANDFHTYYNAHKIIVDDTDLRNARLCLAIATQQVLKNGLKLLGIAALEVM
ncbi:MAG: arginine--tRNA ligase [Legionellales bacterium]|nr:arginine--tRNA ligase [Legionellales bacterium]